MAAAVIMPRQGQSVESCILTQWYKKEGEQVSKGDPLFAYETDKAAFEEEAPEDGLLLARAIVAAHHQHQAQQHQIVHRRFRFLLPRPQGPGRGGEGPRFSNFRRCSRPRPRPYVFDARSNTVRIQPR